MARKKRELELDEIQLWISQGIALMPKVYRTYSLLMVSLVYSGKLSLIPVERMESYCETIRQKQKIS